MSDAFVSYAREDAARVEKLVDLLKTAGIDLWWDPSIRAGENFDEQIEAALEAADCVIGCWSKSAKESDFTRDEMRRAAGRDKLIPVRLDDIESMIGIGNLQYINLVNWDYTSAADDQFVALVRAIDRKRKQKQTPDESPAPISKASRQQVAVHLRSVLDYIDQDSNYDSAWFTPLQAQVSVRRGDSNDDQNVSDLLAALEKADPARMTLVLGLPGSGKSVAMREFSRHILKSRTGSVLPIYINLRDWLSERRWTVEHPPRLRDLEEFIESCLTFENSPAVTAFLADFRKLHAEGHLLWIFDSFDELPAILDAGAGPTAELIKIVSRLLDDFVRQGTTGAAPLARGIIASRFERKPLLPNSRITQLEIQPFSDNRIRDAFRLVKGFRESLVDDIFRPPGDLVPMARTPFYHGLIAEYAVATLRLPRTAAELFQAYTLRRLNVALGLDPDRKEVDPRILQTMQVAEEVAQFLFSSERYGLGAPIAAIKDSLQVKDIDACLERLRRAKIVRRGPRPAEMITFSHRRMHEYFVICYKARTGIPFNLEWVAQDTRERDSAVLHVELLNQQAARDIAQELWLEIRKGQGLSYSDRQFFRALHCQRFLVEAFRTRRAAIEGFRAELEDMIVRQLEESDDIISVKLAVEAIGLLSEHGIERSVAAALRRGDFWIRETAIDACRFLPNLSPGVVGHIWRCVAFMPEKDFLRDLERLRFSFRLSPSLHAVSVEIEKRAHDIRRWRMVGQWIFPAVRFASLSAFMISSIAEKLSSENERRREANKQNPIFLYISDRKMLDTHDIYTSAKDYHSWLMSIDLSKTYGLTRYRSVLAQNGIFLFSTVVMGSILYTPLASHLTGVHSDQLFDPLLNWLAQLPFVAGKGAAKTDLMILPDFRSSDLTFLLVLVLLLAGNLLGGLSMAFLGNRGYRLVLEGELDRPKSFWSSLAANLSVFGGIAMMIILIISIGSFYAIAFLVGRVYYSVFDGPIEVGMQNRLATEFANTAIAVGFGAFIIFGLSSLAFDLSRSLKLRKWEQRAGNRDSRRFHEFTASGHISRPTIAESFNLFETPHWRETYVDWLAGQGIVPLGEWPSGRPPNLNDAASTKLAQLEHRWRGFDK